MMDFNNIKALRRQLAKHCINGDYDGAASVARTVISYYKNMSDDKSMVYANDMFNCAIAYESVGEFKKAMELYADSIKAVQVIKGENEEFVYRIINLAALQGKMGNFKEAIELAKRAVHTIKKNQDINCDLLIDCYYTIGNLYCELASADNRRNATISGDLQESILWLKRALRQEPAKMGASYADTLISIASAFEQQLDYKGAVRYAERALKALQQDAAVTEKDELEVVRCLNYIASLYESDGDYKRCITRLKELVKVMDGLFMPKSQYILSVKRHMADVYVNLGDLQSAVELRICIAEDIKNVSADTHINYANELRDVGLLYRQMSDFKQAEVYLSRSIEIKERLLGSESKDVIKDYILLISVLVETGHFREGLDLLVKTLKAIDANGNELDEFVGKLAELYMSLGDINDLNNMYSKSRKLKSHLNDGSDSLI